MADVLHHPNAGNLVENAGWPERAIVHPFRSQHPTNGLPNRGAAYGKSSPASPAALRPVTRTGPESSRTSTPSGNPKRDGRTHSKRRSDAGRPAHLAARNGSGRVDGLRARPRHWCGGSFARRATEVSIEI